MALQFFHSTPVGKVIYLTLLMPWAVCAQATDDNSKWSASLNTQLQVYDWDADDNSHGSQTYLPLGMQFSGNVSETIGAKLMVRTGYVDSSTTSAGIASKNDGLTDTSLSATLNFNGWQEFQPYLSLSSNLPTGNSKPSGGGKQYQDSDVAATPTYGEGSNVGLTAGSNIPLTDSLVATVAAGYTWRGNYTTINLGEYDPGDVYTLNVGMGYEGDNDTIQLQISFTGETASQQNGVNYYKGGNSVSAVLGLAHAWNDRLASRINLSYGWTDNNKVQNLGVPPLVKEIFNSNSEVVQVDLDTTYSASNFSIGPTLGYLKRNHNSWNPGNLQYLSAKERWTAGLTGQYALNRDTSINASVSHAWMDQDANPGTGTPATTTKFWTYVLGLNRNF